MALEINNQADFFENVVLDIDSNITVEEFTQVGSITKCLDQYDFYKRVKLTDDGNLSIVRI